MVWVNTFNDASGSATIKVADLAASIATGTATQPVKATDVAALQAQLEANDKLVGEFANIGAITATKASGAAVNDGDVALITGAGFASRSAGVWALTTPIAASTDLVPVETRVTALESDTHVHTNKTLLDAIASHGGISIVGQTLTLTKADGTDQSITLPDQVELTRPEPAPTVPDPATATPGTVYVVAGDGAYMVNDAADTMIRVADIATIETMTQAHIDAPDGVGRLVTPELLLSRDFITTIDSQAEAETTTILPGRAGLIGSMPGAENTNFVGLFFNLTKQPQLATSGNRANPAVFLKIPLLGASFAGAGNPVIGRHNIYWSNETAPDLAWLNANFLPTDVGQYLLVSQYSVTKTVYQALSETQQDTHKPPVTYYTSVESAPGELRWTEHESGGGGGEVPESVDSSDIDNSQLWQNVDGQLFFKDKNGKNRGLTI